MPRSNSVAAARVPHKKPNLPTKVCPVCNRPFAWRKKWEKVWEQVGFRFMYTSKAKPSLKF